MSKRNGFSLPIVYIAIACVWLMFFIALNSYIKGKQYVKTRLTLTPTPASQATATPSGGQEVASKEECLEIGGEWRRWGMSPMEFCQVAAPDGGRECNNSSDCSYGICISKETGFGGNCATYKFNPGCHRFIIDGVVSKYPLCVD